MERIPLTTTNIKAEEGEEAEVNEALAPLVRGEDGEAELAVTASSFCAIPVQVIGSHLKRLGRHWRLCGYCVYDPHFSL